GGVALLEEQKIAAVVDDDDGHADVLFFGLGFGAGDHGLDRSEVEIFPGWKIVGKGCSGEDNGEDGQKDSFHARDAIKWARRLPAQSAGRGGCSATGLQVKRRPGATKKRCEPAGLESTWGSSIFFQPRPPVLKTVGLRQFPSRSPFASLRCTLHG